MSKTENHTHAFVPVSPVIYHAQIIFAYMIELLYRPVYPCEEGEDSIKPPPPYEDLSCDEYYDIVADDMQDMSFKVAYGILGTIAATMIGNVSDAAVP